MRNGCILRGGVGTGKSITALAYYYMKVCGGRIPLNGVGEKAPMSEPRDLYIITTAMKRDKMEWEKEADPFALSSSRENTYEGVKYVVDSWNNIAKYADIENAFFIFDEQRLVGSGAWVKAFLKIAEKNQWIVLSATPGDIWMDYVPIFVAHKFFRNRTEFLNNHVIWKRFRGYAQVDRYVDIGILNKYRMQVTVEMPYDTHTKRHVKNKIVQYDKELFKRVQKDRWHIYEERPLNDAGEMTRVMRKLVNSDGSRLDAVIELAEAHPRLIVFYNFDYELETLRTLEATTGSPVAEWNGHKHQPIPKGDKWVYLVQYTAGSEGWNCITTDATVFYSLNYSYKVNEQAKGRIDRMNTPYTDLYYYILRTGSMIDNAIVHSLATKRDFNENKFAKGMAWDEESDFR